ncbi:MAG: hypothetical protein GY909_01775 [Oligoflexia bacterium]|nr:hypothetical protein [Oligoflexia bacterium]
MKFFRKIKEKLDQEPKRKITSTEYVAMIVVVVLITIKFKVSAEERLQKSFQKTINTHQDLSPRPYINKSEESYKEMTGFKQ